MDYKQNSAQIVTKIPVPMAIIVQTTSTPTPIPLISVSKNLMRNPLRNKSISVAVLELSIPIAASEPSSIPIRVPIIITIPDIEPTTLTPQTNGILEKNPMRMRKRGRTSIQIQLENLKLLLPVYKNAKDILVPACKDIIEPLLYFYMPEIYNPNEESSLTSMYISIPKYCINHISNLITKYSEFRDTSIRISRNVLLEDFITQCLPENNYNIQRLCELFLYIMERYEPMVLEEARHHAIMGAYQRIKIFAAALEKTFKTANPVEADSFWAKDISLKGIV
jgi:hypothetical protein